MEKSGYSNYFFTVSCKAAVFCCYDYMISFVRVSNLFGVDYFVPKLQFSSKDVNFEKKMTFIWLVHSKMHLNSYHMLDKSWKILSLCVFSILFFMLRSKGLTFTKLEDCLRILLA